MEYADDTILYVCRQNYTEAIEFFKSNRLAANSSKSNFLVSPYEKIRLKILGSLFQRR